MKRSLLDAVLEARGEKRPLVVVTELGTGSQWLEDEGEPAPGLDPRARDAARGALRRDRSEVVEVAGARYFLHVMSPPLRLFVVGAVHIAQALAPMASLLGYAVTVIDPRRAFVTTERFPDVTVVTDWPDDALVAADLDARSAVVTLTHDPKLDDPALHVALASPAFYIGSLGSRRTHARRIDRLTEAGFAPETLARIRAPVGLDIGAVTAGEIAASIVAELTASFRIRVEA
ncbi:MAG: XdhC family protein [Gammaproteobacteria bacterium]|nr:XdhC family protein [Gammaproteobacteria bacterium]